MAELPVMPLRVDTLLMDTSGMSPEEFGCYARLLFTMWGQGGKLKYDRRKLRRTAGAHPLRWRKIEDTVLAPFTISGGYISQKRLTSTMLNVREYRAGQARKAKAWHERRKNKAAGPFDVISGAPKPLK